MQQRHVRYVRDEKKKTHHTRKKVSVFLPSFCECRLHFLLVVRSDFLSFFPPVCFFSLLYLPSPSSSVSPPQIRNRIMQKYQIPKTSISKLFKGSPTLNIVFTSRFFQPASSHMDEQHFIFVGPSVTARCVGVLQQTQHVHMPLDTSTSSGVNSHNNLFFLLFAVF